MSLLDNYTKTEKVGEGTFGEVFKAIDKRTGLQVAIKRTKLSHEDEGVPSTAIREISLLKDLAGHPNIVELKDVINEPGELNLIFEWVDRDLKKYMDKTEGPLAPMLVKSYMYQMLRGLDACHRCGIMHRDLKPQNILVDSMGMLKLADFGLARAIQIPLRKYTHEIVTLWYRAPEVLLGQSVYAPSVDMWAVGAIFVEMVNKRALWRGDSEVDELFKIFRTMGTPDESVWPGVSGLKDYNPDFPRWPGKPLSAACPSMDALGLDLLKRMLVFDPARRISAKKALLHPYFADLDKSTL